MVLSACAVKFKKVLIATSVATPLLCAEAQAAEPFFGLQIQGLSPVISAALGLKDTKGILVRDVAYPGPGSQSDISRGDIIVAFDGKKTDSVEAVTKMMSAFKPGQNVVATVIRRGKTIDVKYKVGALPPLWDIERNTFATVAPLGLTFAALTDKVQERFKLGWRTRGVVVSLVDEEKAKIIDLKVGDVIVQVNQSPVWTPSHIINYLKKAQQEKKETLLLLVEGTDGFRFVLLPVPVPE